MPTVQYGIAEIESFDGANDDAKFRAAMSYAQQQTYSPVLRTPPRVFDTGANSYLLPTGTRLMGPGMAVGPSNTEQGKRNASGEWRSSAGLNEKALFTIAGNTFGIAMQNLSFSLSQTGQLMHTGSSGNMYSAELNSLTVYGGKHILGSDTQKFLNTYLHLTGTWTAVSLSGVGFHMGGSDSFYFRAGGINLGAHQQVDMNGTPLMWLDYQYKTFVGDVYATADQNARPLKIDGGDVTVDGGVWEGYKDSDASLGTLIQINKGAAVTLANQRFAYGMRAPRSTEQGIIEVNDGSRALITGVKYDRGSTAATVPLVYVDGANSYAAVGGSFGLAMQGNPAFKPQAKAVNGGAVELLDRTVELAA